jgi:cell division protein ZipA
MDGLRWLLLLFGVLVIAGVYVYSRRERDRAERPARVQPGKRVEPSLEASPLPEPDEATFEPDDPAEPDESKEPARQQKIVTLRLVAKGHRSFQGDELILGLRSAGLRHGRFGIFHRYDGDDEKRVVFSAASLVEPGSFDLANIKGQEIPGISLFMVLPGPIDGAHAFDQMMTAGRELARTLTAELLDESGSTMSVQRERYLREEIIQYQHGIKVA